MSWQKIDTAPKDGRFLLLIEHGAWNGLNRPHVAMAYWKPDDRVANSGYWSEAVRLNIQMQPTHWMEIPEAPHEYD